MKFSKIYRQNRLGLVCKWLMVCIFICTVNCLPAVAQLSCDTLSVYFQRGYSTYDGNFRNNEMRMKEFVERIKAVQKVSHMNISRVEYFATTSPEGSVRSNENLAKKRAANLTSILHTKLDFADSIISITTNMGDWERLASKVKADYDVPDRIRVLEIIEQEKDPERKDLLETLNGGKAWDYLLRTHFPDLRSFRVYIYVGFEDAVLDDEVYVGPAPEIEDAPVFVIEDEPIKVDTLPMPVPVPKQPFIPVEPEQSEEESDWVRRLTVKTNLLGWGFLMTNAAVEIDIIEGLSFALPVYYSGWDYFTNTVKFRTLMIQPELRYYIPKTNGLYVGAHFGMGYWNFALGTLGEKICVEDWRYQDHKGESPALGGGISVGYALQFKRNPKWGMEFSLGAGVYDARYDMFYNEANGPYYQRGIHTTFIGVDNASVSFTYKFDLKRKEDRR